MLSVHALSFDYLDKPLLRDVHWSLNSGGLLHVRGGNGVGKTTLLRLLTGLLEPRLGDVLWENHSIYDNLSQYQQHICYVGHKLGLSLELSVRENCFFDMHWQRKPADFSHLLEQFQLKEFENTFCFQLSEGQRRRVALLRLLMTNARLWLLDEPFASLDNMAIAHLSACFEKHLTIGGLIVLTSHQKLPKNLQNHEVYTL